MAGRVAPTTRAGTENLLPETLTEAERLALQERLKEMNTLFDTHKAKYKLEVMFGEERSRTRPYVGILSFWENGSKLNGGGDEKLYICPGKALKRNECEALIPADTNISDLSWCPTCGIRWNGEDVTGEIVLRRTTLGWASSLLYYFRKLDHNADIYLKYAPNDIRSRSLVEQERQRGGEVLNLARKRARAIYPLKNIIKDTGTGADLEGRLKAFLEA